ncbi:MAG: hypothetical protein ACE5JQ_15975 [Candidatus Methylomirabilales bacterium]
MKGSWMVIVLGCTVALLASVLDADDIADGAAEIGVDFIQGNVTGKILDVNGDTVISDNVQCKD